MTATLDGQVLPGLGTTEADRLTRTVALAHIENLDNRSTLDAIMMVRAGTDPAEAVLLAGQDAHDIRVKTAAMQGTALIEHERTGHRRAEMAATAPPTTTMRDVRDGDTIRLNGHLIDVQAIERGTVAYIQPTAGPEFHTALDAPVEILTRAAGPVLDAYDEAEYADERADLDQGVIA